MALGRGGIEGSGGNVALGRGGIVGSVNAGGGAAGVSKRRRAATARLISMLDNDSAMKKHRIRQHLEIAMLGYLQNV